MFTICVPANYWIDIKWKMVTMCNLYAYLVGVKHLFQIETTNNCVCIYIKVTLKLVCGEMAGNLLLILWANFWKQCKIVFNIRHSIVRLSEGIDINILTVTFTLDIDGFKRKKHEYILIIFICTTITYTLCICNASTDILCGCNSNISYYL